MRGTLSDQFRSQHPFFWVVVIAAVYAVFAFVFHGVLLYKYAGMTKLGYGGDAKLRIHEVFPNGTEEGKLQVGDVIRAINGTPATLDSIGQLVGQPIGTDYTLEIERNGIRHQVALTLTLQVSPYTFVQRQTQIAGTLLALGFLLVAILVGLLRPAEPTVRLLFAALYLGGLNNLIGQFLIFTDGTARLISLTHMTLAGPLLVLAATFHLFLRFPPGLPIRRFWEFVKWGLYGVGIVLHAISALAEWNLLPRSSHLIAFQNLFVIISLAALISVVIRNYRLVSEPQQKQRIKWLIGSTAVAVFCYLLSVIFVVVAMPQIIDSIGFKVAVRIRLVLEYLTTLMFLISIVVWAYVILKHRVLDINVVIRRSLRYLLASRGFILIEALLAFALLSFVFAGRLGVWLDRFGSNTRTLITILGTVLMVLGLQSVNRKIRPLIDRRFFRDAYDAQQILTELGSSLRATTNVKQVLELTTAQIQQALYAANVTIFLRNGQHDFQSAVSSDYLEREKSSRTMTRDLHLPEAAFVVQRIHDSAQPAEIDWDDPYSPVATQLAAMANGDVAAQQEFDTLRELKTNLVLPLSAKDELLGVLALGPRAGDLPYSREDKRLLMNVAGQTALALENSRLVERMIEEARRREEIETENEARAKELEDARRLQLSMLPKGNVRLERLEITGTMRTATEVGGDYYDFLPLPDGRYCVVIGDATGHGMSAGLIVGMVKMGLTSRLQTAPSLQPLIEDLNTALKQSLTQRGVGMCLGATIIDPVTLQVELCSNGMPFPYHFTNGELRAIELKAPPLGFLKRVNVPTATLQLQSGEALIWVSDGFEERMNARNEEWGAAQVATALTEICQRESSGEAMARELIAACDRAADGRSNDDDMTIVVMKVLRGSA